MHVITQLHKQAIAKLLINDYSHHLNLKRCKEVADFLPFLILFKKFFLENVKTGKAKPILILLCCVVMILGNKGREIIFQANA